MADIINSMIILPGLYGRMPCEALRELELRKMLIL